MTTTRDVLALTLMRARPRGSSRGTFTALNSTLLALLLLGASCDDAEPSARGDVTEDSASTLDAGDSSDAPTESDVAPDAAPDADATPSPMASLVFGDTRADFEHAFYGLTPPEQSGSGAWEVYIELHVGGIATCPEQDSPSPDQILIMSGLALPGEAPLEPAANLLDIGGQFLDSPAPLAATSVTVSALTGEVCTACVGQPSPSDPDGRVAITFEATFEEGLASGSARAMHCDSFDL